MHTPEQNNEPTNAPATDFSSLKPFKFTITADELFEPSCNKGHKCMGLQFEDKVPYYMNVSTKLGYDLDCDGDGKYEYIGLMKPQRCEFDNHSGNHQISVRGDIHQIILYEDAETEDGLPEDNEDMFWGTLVEKLAEQKPLKTRIVDE